ncbi:MAG: glycoside hydrolase family 130 protein [Nakamurella sp.]
MTAVAPTHARALADDGSLVRRGSVVLRPDPRRIILRLFLPGQEVLSSGISRADAVMRRILDMSEDEVDATLAAIKPSFDDTDAGTDAAADLPTVFEEHYALLEHRLPTDAVISSHRRLLIGAYFTQGYAIEAAALFNPSMVTHPDQSGLSAGEQRFVMSVRAVGEGHISSLEFRSGVISANDDIRFDTPGEHLVTGQSAPAAMPREALRDALAEYRDGVRAEHILDVLPDVVTPRALEDALAASTRDRLTRSSEKSIGERIRWIASCHYRVTFLPEHELSERVIFPTSPDERRGIEDARFTCFQDPDGTARYYATYTAYDGENVAPKLLTTDDFINFESTQLFGDAAKNKGMALFPRQIGGRYWSLSRWDRESIAVTNSADLRCWNDVVTVRTPQYPWELIQLGNCGSPIETSDGWLVLTHGVGPVREYAIGAILLDINDPTVVVGALRRPLLVPVGEEREGYVPNVVYSCGALLHGGTLVLPYGCSDSSIRVAFIDLDRLLRRIHEETPDGR